MYPTEVIHGGKVYQVVDEKPKTRDLVITENYGVWEFSERPEFIPYWCNDKTCKKLIPIGSVLIPVIN